MAYAQWGGFPQVWTDDVAARPGTPVIVFEARERLFAELRSEPEPYLDDNIVWFVLSPEESRLISMTEPLLDRGARQPQGQVWRSARGRVAGGGSSRRSLL